MAKRRKNGKSQKVKNPNQKKHHQHQSKKHEPKSLKMGRRLNLLFLKLSMLINIKINHRNILYQFENCQCISSVELNGPKLAYLGIYRYIQVQAILYSLYTINIWSSLRHRFYCFVIAILKCFLDHILVIFFILKSSIQKIQNHKKQSRDHVVSILMSFDIELL